MPEETKPTRPQKSDWQEAVVKSFNWFKGWGFVVSSEGKELFVHKSADGLGSNARRLVPQACVEVRWRENPNGQGPQVTDLRFP